MHLCFDLIAMPRVHIQCIIKILSFYELNLPHLRACLPVPVPLLTSSLSFLF
jgi:hypothetical protein